MCNKTPGQTALQPRFIFPDSVISRKVWRQPQRGTIPHVAGQHTDEIPIAVISDGKPGHENQSLGLAEHIPGNKTILLRHSLKEGIGEAWLRFIVRNFAGVRANPGKYLKQAFSDAEIKRLIEHSPKAVISAGSLSAAPCLLAGKLTGAKTCVCMRPSLLPLSFFDLAVLPEHDNPPDAPNIVRTLAAPNRVSDERLNEEADKWWDELPPGERVISWIIGGPSASARFDENHVLGGLLETLVWARYGGWQVWLSTARRTPVSLEESIKKVANGYPALTWKLLWHDDHRNPLYAMFLRSRIAVVTSDSVSMIAEAASAGCGPIVYRASNEISGGKHRSKQDMMVTNLIEAGYGTRIEKPEDISGTLEQIIGKGTEFPKLQDTDRAAERLLKLI
jgi:mitochondrial fission protein ELM1